MSALQDVDFSVLELVPLPISAHDQTGAYVFLNEALLALPGVQDERLLGKPLLAYVPEPVRSVVREQVARCLEECIPIEVGAVFTSPRGEGGFTADLLLLPVSRDGRAMGFVAIAFGGDYSVERLLHDASRQVRLTARQEQILRMLDEGRTTTEVADALTLAEDTVRNHIRRTLTALGASTRQEALAIARRRGLLSARPLAPDDVPVQR